MTKKKNRSDTGAKKVIFAASGPGLSFCGSTTPMGAVPTICSNAQVPVQPVAVRPCDDGEIVPAGKSTSAKLVRSSSAKRRARPTSGPSPLPATPYAQRSVPRVR